MLPTWQQQAPSSTTTLVPRFLSSTMVTVRRGVELPKSSTSCSLGQATLGLEQYVEQSNIWSLVPNQSCHQSCPQQHGLHLQHSMICRRPDPLLCLIRRYGSSLLDGCHGLLQIVCLFIVTLQRPSFKKLESGCRRELASLNQSTILLASEQHRRVDKPHVLCSYDPDMVRVI